MADPTPYDILQDNQISALQDIVTPYYTPPGDVEYSFPVVGQGITADQYRLMSLGQANGIIHGDNGVVNDSPNSTGFRYSLRGHATDAETNQRNTLILHAGTSAEAIVEGFYHRLTEDMELSFPAVSTPTTYHVCLTFDPRREDEPTGPIHVGVYAGEPPTTYRRVHVLLHTVHREPNQLLSQATPTSYRPYTAGIVAIQHEYQLPPWRSFPAGTISAPSGGTGGRGAFVRTNTIGDWRSIFYSDWEDCAVDSTWTAERPAQAQTTPYGVQLRGRLSAQGRTGNTQPMFTLPSGMRVATTFRCPVWATGGELRMIEVRSSSGGRNVHVSGDTRPGYVEVDSILIPRHMLAN